MGLRFYRRVHLAPGLSVNLSGSGPSLSFGVRGAHVTVGRRGVSRTVGIPGTGLFYTSRQGYHTGCHSAAADAPRLPAEQAATDRQAERTVLLVMLGVAIGLAIAWLL